MFGAWTSGPCGSAAWIVEVIQSPVRLRTGALSVSAELPGRWFEALDGRLFEGRPDFDITEGGVSLWQGPTRLLPSLSSRIVTHAARVTAAAMLSVQRTREPERLESKGAAEEKGKPYPSRVSPTERTGGELEPCAG